MTAYNILTIGSWRLGGHIKLHYVIIFLFQIILFIFFSTVQEYYKEAGGGFMELPLWFSAKILTCHVKYKVRTEANPVHETGGLGLF